MILGLATLLSAQALGCGSDDDGDRESTGSTEGLKSADCIAITRACHEFDEGDGEASECHETAHEDDADACRKVRTSCIEACK